MTRQIAPVTPPPRPGKAGGLGDKVEVTIVRAVATIFNSTRQMLVEMLSGALELFLDVLKPVLRKAYGPLLESVRDQPGTPDELKTLIDTALTSGGQAGAALLMSAGTTASGGLLGAVLGPPLAKIGYKVNRWALQARADVPTALAIYLRRPDLQSRMLGHILDQGWNEDLVTAFLSVIQRRASEVDLVSYMLRGKTNKASVDAELRKRGWGQDDIAILHEMSHLIPGPGDLIAMAVREAFSPEMIRSLGLDAEFPDEFGVWMSRQGYSREWAERYWYAHWSLPSLTMAFEMLHRRVIDQDTLNQLLKAQDISPTWRDRLTAISYSPLTRVDVRRMYGLGVLDAEDVYNSYRDIGYNDENAQRMTEFTVLYETDADREASKSDILAGLREGMLTGDEAAGWLQEIGYSTDLAAYYVAQETAKVSRKLLDARISTIEDLYVARDITEPEARTQLTALGLASSEIDVKIDSWRIQRDKRVKRPTQSQYDQFLIDDIITESDYRAGLTGLGFQDQYIAWYTDRVLARKAEEARRDEEKTREEQEKVRTRKLRTDYQVAKAALDVDLAEVRTAIAEQQIAIHARRARFETELEIVREAVTVAELEEAAAADIADLESDVAALRDAQSLLREKVDALQTLIAGNRLAQAEYNETMRSRLAAAATDEETAALKQEAAARKLAFETERREWLLQVEKNEDDVADAATEILDNQHAIASRRVELRTQIDVVERLRSEVRLRSEYETDVADMQKKLDDLRLNSMELREHKAKLAVGYRSGLSE